MALDDVIDASVEITIGNYIVRRLEEQGVKVGSKLFVIFTLIDLGVAVYVRSAGIVSCQLPSMSILVSS